MSFKKDLRQLVKPYYWFNILMSICYIVCKRTPVLCDFLHPDSDCELDARETEILFFLVIVVMLRTRKAGSVTMVNYLTSSFVYTKIANLILWFYADVRSDSEYDSVVSQPKNKSTAAGTSKRKTTSTSTIENQRYGLGYGAIFILAGLLLPEPTYDGPEHVVYFRGSQSLEEELQRHKSTVWVLCLYAAWHPACVNFAPVFAELSSSYGGLDNLKFGKLDVGRYPDAATKFRIQDGPTSRQLPTVLLLKAGEETERRPQADRTGKLQKFLFSKDNMKAAFDLDGLYQDCKQKLKEVKSDKKSQ